MNGFMELSPETLVELTGIGLSLLFAYFPWVKEWFDSLDKKVKPLLNAFILLVAAWIYLAVGCELRWSCMELHAFTIMKAWFYALVANQTTYLAFVRQNKKAS